MKIYLTLLLIILSFFFSHANEISYKIKKHQKIERTFSGDINQKQSVQLIILKDKITKTYEIIPFFFNKENKATEFDFIPFKKLPSILSYHFNNNTLTLITTQKIKNKTQLIILDLDINTRMLKSKIIDDFKDSDATFRLGSKTIFIHKTDDSIKITEIENSLNLKENKINTDSKNFKEVEYFFETRPDIININEYVENGSINKFQGYYNENHLIFTKINKNNTEVNLFKVDLNNYSSKLNKIPLNNLEGTKDLNTYFHNNNLYAMLVSKSDAYIKVIDIINNEVKFSKSLNSELKNNFNSEDLQNFIKKSSRKRNKPTITVNKSIENKLVLNIDYVDTTIYNYNYNWWFHHWMWQQQMQMHMQQVRMNAPSFGPNPAFFNYDLMSVKKESNSLKLVFDLDFTINKLASIKTIKKDIDKEKHINTLKENTDFKHITVSFQENTIRSIYYSKKLKQFYIKTSNL